MNKKTYWRIRATILNSIFIIKRLLYIFFDYAYGNNEYKSFYGSIIQKSILAVVKDSVILLVVLWLDKLILKINNLPLVNNSFFIPTVIGGVSVAGIILGLYCANISSIYTSRYASAPRIISIAFQNDKLSRKCISMIVDYIVFGFLVVIIAMLKSQISWAMVITFIFFSIAVVISYSIAGNRAYQLSDIYSLAADSNRTLYRIISNWLNHRLFATDISFQNHFMKIAEKQLRLRRSIQRYGSKVIKNENLDNTTMIEYMSSNIALVELYWANKGIIGRNSPWFRETAKYSKWHLSDISESSVALSTGTALRTKAEHNYWWFEEELLSINKNCLNILFDQEDYLSIFSYLLSLEKMSSAAVKYKEANFYVEHINWIRRSIERNVKSYNADGRDKNGFANVIETVSKQYLELILEFCKLYKDYNLNDNAAIIINAIDSGVEIEKIEAIRGKQDREFFTEIITEVKVEGKRITPSWIIKQQIAKEEYVYLNSLLDIIREGMNCTFKLGEALLEKEIYFETCIILTRFYEYESKLARLVMIAEKCRNELVRFHIDEAVQWDEFRLGKLQRTISEWKMAIPTLLYKSSSRFAIENWNNREDYPDFLGECYNHICEDAVEAIIKGDIKQFEIDFGNLSKIMLLYQEYIKDDFIENKDIYRIEYAYYMVTSPIIEWAQIGGLALLWGEFHSEDKWKKSIRNSTDSIFKKDGVLTELAEKLVEYVQGRDRFMFLVANRDILETGWQQRVVNTIRDSGICKTECGVFESQLKTDSQLLKAFCPDFMDMGFMSDPSEVFWVICVNPLLSDEKKFHTKISWEDSLND